MVTKKFLRPSEVARLLGVSRSTVYRWFWEGKLRGIKFCGKNVRIDKESVDRILSQNW